MPYPVFICFEIHATIMKTHDTTEYQPRNIEDMMQIIAAQGRVISEELNMMSPDCATTSSSQQPRNLAKQQTRNLSSQQPHNLAATSASRSYDAGLNRSTSKASAMRSLERPRKRERSEPALNQRQATSSAEEQTDFEQGRNLESFEIFFLNINSTDNL